MWSFYTCNNISIYPATGNLALGKKATMSSQYGGFAASRGVNGKTTDFFHTRYQNMPWFRVDLGRSYNVQRVVLFNRKDCCGKLYMYLILIKFVLAVYKSF